MVPTDSKDKLYALARERLAEIEVERARLLAFLGDTAPARNGRSHVPAPKRRRHPSQRRRAATLAQQRGATPFRRRADGPTETLLKVLREAFPNGLTFTEAVSRALQTAQSDAKNPTRSVGNVLLSLRKRERVRHADGKYYWKG